MFLMAMKWAFFVRRSTMTHIALLFLLVGCKPTTKSMQAESHFHSWISKGCKSLVGLRCSAFTRWHVILFATKSSTSCFILLHQKVRFKSSYNLHPPGWVECRVLCPLSRIFLLSSFVAEIHTRFWNLSIPSSWVTKLGIFPADTSVSILSN